MKEKVIKTQEEYFNILCNYFGELINIENEKHDIDTSIRSYLLKQKPIYISSYKDSDSYKRHLFFETIDRFWKKNETILLNFIKEKKNVGIFGIGDSIFASKYCEEIGRNSLFYDVIILGDPFDTGYSTSEEYDTDHNIKAICANVLYMWKIKEFILDKEQEVFVLIFPLNAFCVANELSSNPIIGSDEWNPLLRDLKGSFFQASPNYMYTCAIHRNDKMSSLMFLEPNEVKTMHNKKNIEEYRKLFYSATSNIEYSYGDVDKIADEVFIKLDEAIDNELKNKKVKRKKERWSSIIGFVKGGMGFVPILSYAISGWDMISSGRSIVQNLKDKESLIDHLVKKTIPK